MEEFPLKGEWWFAGIPDKKIPGTLNFSNEAGARLELFGILSKGLAKPSTLSTAARTILGKAYGLPKITLFDSVSIGSHTGSSEIVKEEFAAQLVLLGKHYETESDVLFDGFYSDLTHINEWADFRAIEYRRDGGAIILRIDFESAPSKELLKTNVFAVKVFAGLEFKPADWYSYSTAQTTRLGFQFNKPASLKECWLLLRDMQNLFTLLIGDPVFTSNTTATAPGEGSSIGIKRRMHLPDSVKALQPMDVILPLKKIGDRSQEIFSNWFSKAERLRPIHDLAFGTIYNENMYAETRFLSIVQALESYHRRMKDGKELPEEQHAVRLAEIYSATPNHEEWLRGKLGYSNEVSLRKRLNSLFAQFPKYAALVNRRTERFLGRVVITRNYLTHFDESNRKGSFVRGELYFSSEKLRVLFWMCMLTELGYSNSDAEEIALRHTYFSRLLNHN